MAAKRLAPDIETDAKLHTEKRLKSMPSFASYVISFWILNYLDFILVAFFMSKLQILSKKIDTFFFPVIIYFY